MSALAAGRRARGPPRPAARARARPRRVVAAAGAAGPPRAGRRVDEARSRSRWRSLALLALPAVAERPSARQLLGQPPHRGVGVGRPRRRPLHPRPGGDPDLPGARPGRRRGARRASARRSQQRLVLTVDGRRVAAAARRAGRSLTHPAGQGGLRTTRVELPLTARGATAPRAGRGARRDVPGPRRLEGGRRAARAAAPPCARALPAERPDRAACARYPQDAAASPADVRAATLRRRARRGTLEAPDGRGGSAATRAARATALRACSATPPPARACWSLLLLTAFALGRAARALARPRQGDGRRVPGRHARDGAARRRARRDRDGHAHDRRVRARARRARAVAVRAARGPVPVAEPRVRPARGRASARRAALARARAARAARARHHHHHSPRSRPRHALATRRPSGSRGAGCSRWARRPG